LIWSRAEAALANANVMATAVAVDNAMIFLLTRSSLS
jgi:hypothetical protein